MLFLITRHGETIENLQQITQGHIDGTLSEKGVQQAKQLGIRLRDFPIDVIISSDLGRAKHTAQLILESHITLIPIIYDSLLRERDSGIFQGRKKEEIMKEYQWELNTLTRSDFLSSHEGETLLSMYQRVQVFMEKI